MKLAAVVFLLLSSAVCRAEIFILTDGARLEGEATGEMDGTLLIKTKYGSLTVNRTDIAERQPSAQPGPAPQAAAGELSTAAAIPAAVESSTAQPAAVLPVQVSTEAVAGAAMEQKPPLTFLTLAPGAGTRKLLYYENSVAIATETFDASGSLVSLEGALKNGTYSEYYENGALKTVKSVSGGKTSGTLKVYYPSGSAQIEAYYLAGAKEGTFKYYGEDGHPLMEASYRNDRLNGWKKEYDPGGTLKTGIFYVDDRATDPPGEKKETGKEEESLVTATATRVARGEIFSFRLNDKYLGKTRLDTEFNVITQEGKIPDGTVKIYSRDGKLQKELLFKQNEIKIVRVFEEGGSLKATYTVREGKATKFALQ